MTGEQNMGHTTPKFDDDFEELLGEYGNEIFSESFK